MSCFAATLHARRLLLLLLLRPHTARLKNRPIMMLQTTLLRPTPSSPSYSTGPSSCPSRLPSGSWDTHMHLIDPAAFPLAPDAKYTPATAHSPADALAFYASRPLLAPMTRLVVVQPSIYGTDNRCTLAALAALGPERARAVVALPPATSPATLSAWHALGVRGVRLNFKSVGRVVAKDELATELRRAADAVRAYGWAVQLYLGLESVPVLEQVVVAEDPPLGVTLVVDHLGHPTLPESSSSNTDNNNNNKNNSNTTPHDPYTLPGFASLVRLAQHSAHNTRTFVKLSAAYRIEPNTPSLPWVGAMARELLRAAPRRVLFATDWPHTRFDAYDVVPFARRCLEWCGGDAAVEESLFRGNAEAVFA